MFDTAACERNYVRHPGADPPEELHAVGLHDGTLLALRT
jgi:hypothetical protein